MIITGISIENQSVEGIGDASFLECPVSEKFGESEDGQSRKNDPVKMHV